MLHALGWPVLAEPRSGARVPHRLTIAAADALLRVPAFVDAHRPDVVLHLGEPWASRVVNEWLASCQAAHVVVDPHGAWPDPQRVGARFVRGPVDPIAEDQPEDGWVDGWVAAESAAETAIAATCGGASAVVRDRYAAAGD